MKKLFSFVIACMTAATMVAQSSLLATLSHEGQIKTFYGSTAYKEALAEADNGDAITLSSGQFVAGNITKAVTIHGAGMSFVNDSVNSHEQTIVQGAFDINIADSTDKRLSIEGLYFQGNVTYKDTVRNSMFMKTRFNNISPSNGTLVNSTFIHCRIASGFKLSSNSNAVLINSVVWMPHNKSTSSSNFEFDNCVIGLCALKDGYYYYYEDGVINSYYKNSIIFAYGSSSYNIPSSCTAYNCVAINSDYRYDSTWDNLKSRNNTNTLIQSSIFKSGYTHPSGSQYYYYSDIETYELTDGAKAKYLGTDGNEVGIYGGSLPYEENPTSPQITKCNVAAKSTADGKLSVDIEVKAAE